MGRQAMEEAIRGHDVIHAMHRKGLGWVDFLQGDEGGGILHILKRRNEQHALDPTQVPDGPQTLRMLPEVIAKGRISEDHTNRVTLILGDVKVILARVPRTPSNGIPEHVWVVSGYQMNRPVKPWV